MMSGTREAIMPKFPLVAAASLVIPAPLLAQIVIVESPPVVQPMKADASKTDWDKVECRSQDELGSRLRKHQVCLTKWQWFSYEQEEKNLVYDWQRIGLNVSH
jgi:hypothetical protein